VAKEVLGREAAQALEMVMPDGEYRSKSPLQFYMNGTVTYGNGVSFRVHRSTGIFQGDTAWCSFDAYHERPTQKVDLETADGTVTVLVRNEGQPQSDCKIVARAGVFSRSMTVSDRQFSFTLRQLQHCTFLPTHEMICRDL